MEQTILSDLDTLAKASAALESGAITSLELTTACLKRCAAMEPTLHCFITLMQDQALAMARAADSLRRGGAAVAPVAGIPLAVKDIIDVASVRCTGHSRLYADRVAPRDATVVAALRAAGAVILGKVTTNEFAIGMHDETALAPNARNPWNTAHSPGGSSSGSGASVAAGEVFGALGTDTGGSIRVPAAFNGIVGLKPSRGLVSHRGVMPLSKTMDNVGPMARTVEDVAILLDAMLTQEDAAVAGRSRAEKSFRTASEALPPTAGYVRVRDFDDLLPAAQRRVLDEVETLLRAIGVTPRATEIRGIEELDAISAVIATCESWHYHRERLSASPQLYGRDARLKLHLGALVSGDDYLLAMARRAELVACFEATMGPADILLLPTTFGPAPALAKPAAPVNFAHWSRVGPTAFANALGGPALALPCGMAGGLPLSVQLIGRYGCDAAVLAIGRALQAAIATSPLAVPMAPHN
ncbi:amidase [Bradyrhizobium sp. CNPSo 4010]|uniref:Indoleacetamide hydrolase n=1 Tax=Bradyrhizobium agreste TaxID=2751811 RepID=A0ABS0PJ65_9BRAD|nr:amidase [Bradyrhizobium agreste]MBH5397242.1 amidase [Bradyrhizobium agreste]